MKYPTSDLYDRYSIEYLKAVRANADNGKYMELMLSEMLTHDYQPEFVLDLIEINGQIWDLESDIRKGKERELGLEEVGKRALAIRDLNAKRIAIKNKVATHFDEFEEKKFDHASITQG